MFYLAVSSRGEASGGGSVVGIKRSRKREAAEEEDPYGGSTDKAEDMETDVEGEKVCVLVPCTIPVGVDVDASLCMAWNYQLVSNVAGKYHSKS